MLVADAVRVPLHSLHHLQGPGEKLWPVFFPGPSYVLSVGRALTPAPFDDPRAGLTLEPVPFDDLCVPSAKVGQYGPPERQLELASDALHATPDQLVQLVFRGQKGCLDLRLGSASRAQRDR